MKTWVKILIVVSAIVGTLLLTLVVLAVATPSTTAPETHKAPAQHTSTVQATPQPTKQQSIPVMTYEEYAARANPEHSKIIDGFVNNDHPEYGPWVVFTVYVEHPTETNIKRVSTEIAHNMSGISVEMVTLYVAHTTDLNASADYTIDLVPIHPINKINAVKASDVHNYYTSGDFYVSNPTAQ